MASITKTVDAQGNPVYKVQASGGRGRRVKRSWRPEPGWSAKTIERELNKFAAQLEKLSAGMYSRRTAARILCTRKAPPAILRNSASGTV